ncbi:10422_t:CDS:2, partial [Cetraspora pellucida]
RVLEKNEAQLVQAAFRFDDLRDKLDKVLTKLQTTNSRMAVIQEKKKLLGIITLQDVLSALVGKIKDEKEILSLPRR